VGKTGAGSPRGGEPVGVQTLGRRAERPDAIAPDGSEIRLLAASAPAATRASLCEVLLPAGGVSRPVRHRTVEELWYVLEGLGDVWRCPPGTDPAESEPLAVGPGDSLVIPTGWSFQFRAGDSAPLRFLCFTCPPWPGDAEAISVERGGFGEPTV
jgi:mannose-6-phosphate isomerase-like protein (cupin superfamily)